MKTRVAITGVGSYIPKFGVGVQNLYNAVFSGGSLITFYEPENELEKKSSKVRGYCEDEILETSFNEAWENRKDSKRMDKFLKFAVIASQEAINDSFLTTNDFYSKEKIGVITGTGIGGVEMISNSSIIFSKSGQRRISPFTIPYGISNMASSLIAMKYGLQGPSYSISSACTSSNHAIINATQLIELGICDAVVVVGTESTSNSFAISGFDIMHALSSKFNDNPTKASRPMDKNRDGFVMSEGAGAIVIENYDKAKQRGAKIYSEIVGYGMSCVASHITAPDSEGLGAFQSMKHAVEYANISKKDISLINMHATSTPLGDVIEAKAVLDYFGKDNHPFLSATKNCTGHMIGAASIIELLLSIESLKQQICPPNINLDDPEDIILSMNMKKEAQKMKNCKYALSNSFGFGGTNSSILIMI